jgi:hypothetical protein
MKPATRLLLAALALCTAAACTRTPTASDVPPASAPQGAFHDDSGGYIGSGLKNDTTTTPPAPPPVPAP